ncbi:MAG TPA: hypothetical protein VGK39_07245, partial [Cyclobacteriaceae bacterium]
MEPVVQDYTSWNQLAQNIAFGCWAASILIVLGHLIKLAITKDAKDKYDYINKTEINLLWVASIILV